MIRKFIPWLVVVVLVWAVLTLPASLFLEQDDSGLVFNRVEGTIWSGEARVLLPSQGALPVAWAWDGGLNWHWSVRSEALALQGRWRLTDRQRLTHITGHVAISALDVAHWLVVIWPEGQLRFDGISVRWTPSPDASLEAEGEIVWENARLAGLVNEGLGDITILLAPSDERSGQTRVDIASSAQGAVSITGEIITDGREYHASLWLKPNDDRSELWRYLSPLGQRRDGAIRIERSGYVGVWQ